MGGPEPQQDAGAAALLAKAREDELAALRDRLSDETRQNLIRFGRARSLTGAGPSLVDLGPSFKGLGLG